MDRMASSLGPCGRCRVARALLFGAHSAQLGDAGVLFGLSSDECREFRRVIPDRFRALFGYPLAHCRIGEGLYCRLMELLPDVGGHARGREQSEPVGDVESSKF